MKAMEFEGNEIFITDDGAYEYSGVIHDQQRVFGYKLNSEDTKEVEFKFADVLSVWRKEETSASGLNKHFVSVSFLCDLVSRFTGLDVQPHAIEKCIEVIKNER